MNHAETVQAAKRAVTQVLKRQGYVSAVDVLLELGKLKQQDVEDWRRGRVPYLERRVIGNLSKLSLMLREMRKLCRELGLKPSSTAYCRWGNGPKTRLRFSRSGERNVEDGYATHWLSKRHAQTTSKTGTPTQESNLARQAASKSTDAHVAPTIREATGAMVPRLDPVEFGGRT